MENPNPYHQPTNTSPNPFFQQQQQPGSHKIGVRYGIGMLIGGAVIVAINVIILLVSEHYLPKLLFVGLVLFLSSPIFMIFPGRPVAQKPEKKDMGKALWRNSSGFHKAMWITWSAVAAVATFFLMDFFGLSLLR